MPEDPHLSMATMTQLVNEIESRTQAGLIAFINPPPNSDQGVPSTFIKSTWWGNSFFAAGVTRYIQIELDRTMAESMKDRPDPYKPKGLGGLHITQPYDDGGDDDG